MDRDSNVPMEEDRSIILLYMANNSTMTDSERGNVTAFLLMEMKAIYVGDLAQMTPPQVAQYLYQGCKALEGDK